jgi:hypothetical protein
MPAVGAALALVLALGGCGGSGKDEQAIRKRVTTFDNALAAKDPARVCASISSELKRQLTKTPSGTGGPKSCEGALRFNFLLVGNAFKKLARAKIDDVQVDGDQARATISYRGRKQRLGAAKQGGEWRITTLRLK